MALQYVVYVSCCGKQEVRIPSAGRKGEPKNPCELKDDTNSAREDKQVCSWIFSCVFSSNTRIETTNLNKEGHGGPWLI